MKKSLFQSTGRFYKANLHTHTNVSDGRLSPEESKKAYQALGYEVVAFTDHEVMVPHPELKEENFLPLTALECEYREEFRPFYDPETGEEITPPMFISRRKVYHLIYLAPRENETYYPWPTKSYVRGNARAFIQDYYVGEKSRSFMSENVNAAIKDAKDHGFLVEYCHPFWSQNRFPDYACLENIDFVETFNSACMALGYALDNSERPYDDLLSLGKHVCPTCSDDSHYLEHIGHAATYIKADSLTYEDVFKALKERRVYSSMGPQFKDITFDPETGELDVETETPVRMVFLTSSVRVAQKRGELTTGTITNASFNIKELVDNIARFSVPERHYIRVTLLDENGKKAYSRGYFLDELMAL